VHPAAATHIRSAAHIAIIAACFFIKVTPRENGRSVSIKRETWLKIHKVSVSDIVSRDF
jgi:hypothetical protein